MEQFASILHPYTD